MVEVAEAQSERRKASRLSGSGLIAEIRGKTYEILDISFGGIKVHGPVAAAGGLITLTIQSDDGDSAEVRARVERVEGDLTAVRFSNMTAALTRLIAERRSA